MGSSEVQQDVLVPEPRLDRLWGHRPAKARLCGPCPRSMPRWAFRTVTEEAVAKTGRADGRLGHPHRDAGEGASLEKEDRACQGHRAWRSFLALTRGALAGSEQDTIGLPFQQAPG